MLEDVTYDRSLIILLSLSDPNILKQSKFTDLEIKKIKDLAPKKLHRQRKLKEHAAVFLMEVYFLLNKQ